MTKKNGKHMIPNGYTQVDTDRRLDWIREKTGVEIDPKLATFASTFGRSDGVSSVIV